MSPTGIITLLCVGLVAGLLAKLAVGGVGYGTLGDIIIGIIGAFVGSWLVKTLGLAVPVTGMTGTILVAFVGAVVLLLLLRILRSSGLHRPS